MLLKALLFHSFLLSATSASICPILGPVFPAPNNLHSSSTFQDALKIVQSNIDKALASGNSVHGPLNPNDTYSIQIFSTASERPLLDYHRRGPAVLGNRTIDGDSVYRIASVSKLITVYLLLLEAGEAIFSDKLTKYLPELQGVASWDDITIGSLAGHLGGIAAELFDVSALAGGDIGAFLPGAFPPLATNETSGCSYGSSGCTRAVFIKNLLDRRPIYLPNTTPAYSNTAFATLGLALESITNSTFDQVLRDLLIKPLHLNGTTLSAPTDLTYAVIPGDETTSGWNLDLRDTPGAAMGGIFSSPNDLSAIGRSILSSSLLPSSTARAWLKPTSFTSSLLGAAGRPWEIYRAALNADRNRVIDLYTKSGNLPGYGANLVLIPDFDMGFVVMMAGVGTVGTVISGVIVDDLLPALDEAAREQADAIFAGTFAATNGLNSTVKLTTAPGVPGLSIEEWISNGTDLRRSRWLRDPEWFQMYPTNIASEDGREISWRSSYVTQPETGSPFDACPSWFAIDRPNYGIYGVDEFVFHIGKDGRAWGLEPTALKIVLERV